MLAAIEEMGAGTMSLHSCVSLMPCGPRCCRSIGELLSLRHMGDNCPTSAAPTDRGPVAGTCYFPQKGAFPNASLAAPTDRGPVAGVPGAGCVVGDGVAMQCIW